MSSANASPNVSAPADASVEQIAAFMRACSFEATRPSASDIAGLAKALPPGVPVYLTSIPGKPLSELVESSMAVRAAGLEPVPHLSARHFETLETADAHVGDLVKRAGARSMLLVGGDIAHPKGEVRDALSLIESGIFEKHGVARVDLPGFPDGHPQMSEDELEANLVTKLAALQRRGLESEIVTQFCFDAGPVLAWIDWLRARGINAPVRIGLAGPTSLLTWLNYARKCGVKASAEALASRSGLVKQAFKAVAPDPLIRTLAGAVGAGRIQNVQPHLFAFGGIGQTAQWAKAPMTGAIRLNREGGFDAL
ncbi:MAG: Methylenetetrahydrofolate reductase [Hyphomicrobiales bacterium]|nr:Methylenetetrahydrofolate reductase [Hyphomicrobiales bacterium]